MTINSNPNFDIDQLINHISDKLQAAGHNEVGIVLIKWIEVLHNIQNVNILSCVPRFLEKLLINIDSRNQANLKT